jgi:hypothetical protein
VGGGADPRDLDLARRQVEKEQYHKALESFSGPHFDGEEISGHDELPVPGEKLFPGRLPVALGRGLDPVPFENRSNRATGQLVSQMK